MQPVATVWSLDCVCLFVITVSHAKMAELIKMLLMVLTLVQSLVNRVLDAGANRCHLANTIEVSAVPGIGQQRV